MFAAWTVAVPWPLALLVILLAVVGVVLGAAEAVYTVKARKDGEQ